MSKINDIANTIGYIGLRISHLADAFHTILVNQENLKNIPINQRSGISHKQGNLVSAMIASIGELVMITSLSWLEEYEEQITPINLPEYQDKVSKYKYICKPVVKRIKKWSGLREYRNVVLAHNLKISGVSVFSPNFKPIELKLPGDETEMILLISLIEFACNLFIQIFHDENEIKIVYLFDKLKRITERIDFNDDFSDIQKSVLEKKKEWAANNGS